MTYTFNLSVREKRVEDIIDAWKQQGNAAHKITEAIKKAFAEEQKGQKIDAFVNQSKLELLPPAFDFWSRDDIKPLNTEDMKRVYQALLHNRDLVLREIQLVKTLI